MIKFLTICSEIDIEKNRLCHVIVHTLVQCFKNIIINVGLVSKQTLILFLSNSELGQYVLGLHKCL